VNLFDLYARIVLDTGEYEKGLSDASGKTSGFADKLKNGLATAAKVGGAAITAASAGIAALTKASIEGYSEYEQLVGGVETLFKSSSDIVMGYAENAYKTAGLSANEYMNTVTSFSASLLQGLGGDTEAAAKLADRAITDMSDNANKMGTDISMIQNAYQGFAKQNYTMLDNLKLGYGGTQAEMARLINDSGVLGDAMTVTAETVNQVSFDKIIEAIGIVQDRMGITGTTALEASTTIQGSISSMKAAWENFITGMADPNQDFDALLGNLVDSVGTVGENLIPRIQMLLPRLTEGITQLAQSILPHIPETLQSLLPAVVEGATGLINGAVEILPDLITTALEAIPQLAEAAVSIIENLGSALIDAAPQLLSAGADLLDQLVTGIETGLPDMIARLPQIIDGFLNYITENLPKVLDKGVELLDRLATGIIEAIPDLLERLPEIITSITEFFTENFPKIVTKGGELLGKLIAGILGAIPEIAKNLPDVIAAIVEALEAGWTELKNVGKYLLEGLWEGISSKVTWLKEKVGGVVNTIKGWFTGKKGFDEHSPSKWSNQVFRYVMEGGGEGLEAGLPGLMRSVDSVTDRVKNGMDFGTAKMDLSATGVGRTASALRSAATGSEGPITIIVQSILDGNIIGESVSTYQRNKERAYGLA